MEPQETTSLTIIEHLPCNPERTAKYIPISSKGHYTRIPIKTHLNNRGMNHNSFNPWSIERRPQVFKIKGYVKFSSSNPNSLKLTKLREQPHWFDWKIGLWLNALIIVFYEKVLDEWVRHLILKSKKLFCAHGVWRISKTMLKISRIHVSRLLGCLITNHSKFYSLTYHNHIPRTRFQTMWA